MRRLLFSATILVLTAIALTACGSAPTPTPAPTSVPQVVPTAVSLPASTATPGPTELRSTILAAINAQKDKAWRQRSEVTLADGSTHTTVIEYAPPDRYHIVSDSTTELVVLGQKVYLKQNAAWAESQIPVASIIDPDAFKKLESSNSDVQPVGADTLNGKPMRVYQYKSKATIGPTEAALQVKIWTGQSDNLPYKMIVEGQSASLDQRTGQVIGVQSTSTILFEYDPMIKVEAPIQ
jgi:hypothetical protein